MPTMNTTRLLAPLVVVLAAASSAPARPPSLERLFPAGAQRGTTATVAATGTFDHWPARGWSDDPGLDVTAAKAKGTLSVRVAPDVAPGVHWIRLSDDEGATALRPFVVGNLPEIVEKEEKDDAPTTLAQHAVTINGRLGRRGDVDLFSIALKKGQTVVAAVDASRHLGSPMDAVIQVANRDGFVLAQNDDDRGFDPLVTLEAPADGVYQVRLFAFPATPNSTIAFAGGDDYLYRLTVTTGGYLDHGYPLAVPRADPGAVEVHGWNVPPAARRVEVRTDGTEQEVAVLHPALAGEAGVRLVTHPARTELEPNDAEHPQRITIPSTLSGRIDPPRDRDVFEFQARKGQALSFAIESRTLGAPLDPVLRVTDAQGKTLSEVDDAGGSRGRRRRDAQSQSRDPQIAFTAPADGAYRLEVRDLHAHGGERFVYLLNAEVPEPGFSLSLSADRFTLTPGKPLEVTVAIGRQNGYKGSVELRVEGLPDGVQAAPVRSEAGKKSADSVTLVLTAGRGPASGPLRIVGQATDGTLRPRTAHFALPGLGATTDRPWLTVLKPKPSGAKPPAP